jgi:hypothetical protein
VVKLDSLASPTEFCENFFFVVEKKNSFLENFQKLLATFWLAQLPAKPTL